MTMTRIPCLTIGLIGLLGAACCAAKDLMVHAGTLIDGITDTPRQQMWILIHDDKIESVVSGFVSPAGAEVIDLTNATVTRSFVMQGSRIYRRNGLEPLP
jgi:hypothetical protein